MTQQLAQRTRTSTRTTEQTQRCTLQRNVRSYPVIAEEDDRLYETRMPSSVRRYQPPTKLVLHEQPKPLPKKRHVSVPANAQPARAPRPWSGRLHPLSSLGAGMLGALLLFTGGVQIGNWYQNSQLDQQFGRPRTYQTDARVGHHDALIPSHFIAINLNRHVEVIEIQGGDATHTKIYQGPILTGDGQDLAPVIVSFQNDHGRIDMVITVEQTRYVFVNDGNAFRPAIASDQVR